MRALLLALLAACAPPPAFTVSPAFDADEQEQIARAAEEWNKRTVPEAHITVTGGEWRILKEIPHPYYNGSCSRSGRWIKIRPNPTSAAVYDIALHEFGHAIGLGHVPRGVMNPEVATVEFSDEDMAECRRVGACK